MVRTKRGNRWFEVRPSPIQGLGGFATRSIPRGTRVVEYTGERITHAVADARYDDAGMRRHHTFLFTVKTYGPGVVRDIVREVAARPFPEAWQAATGVPLQRTEAEWRRGSLLLYRWVPALTGTTALWTGITLLALLAGARRRARTRRILEAWQAEEEPAPPDEIVH